MTNYKCEFYSPINIESSWGMQPVSSNMRSTMEFFNNHNRGVGEIEWIVYDADGNDEFVEHIGIWYDIESRQITDYDGVFSLPLEAMQLLAYAGTPLTPKIGSKNLRTLKTLLLPF